MLSYGGCDLLGAASSLSCVHKYLSSRSKLIPHEELTCNLQISSAVTIGDHETVQTSTLAVCKCRVKYHADSRQDLSSAAQGATTCCKVSELRWVARHGKRLVHGQNDFAGHASCMTLCRNDLCALRPQHLCVCGFDTFVSYNTLLRGAHVSHNESVGRHACLSEGFVSAVLSVCVLCHRKSPVQFCIRRSSFKHDIDARA